MHHFFQQHSSKIILILLALLIVSNLPMVKGVEPIVTPQASQVIASPTFTAAVVSAVPSETALPSATPAPTMTYTPTFTVTPSPTLTATATATLHIIMPSPTKRKREKTPVAASQPQIINQGPTAACLTVVCTAD